MATARVYRQAVRYVRNGEAVEAGVANRPVRDLHGNVAAIREIVESMQVGQAIILRDQTVEASLSPGQPVYMDAATATWRPARATLTMSGTDAGVWAFGPNSHVGGVLESRVGSRGSVVIAGKIRFSSTWVLNTFDGAYAAGPVYLSRNTAGKLSTGRELSVRVGAVSGPDQDGMYTLYVAPSSREGITTHSHLRVALSALPAGTPNRAPEHYDDTLLGEMYAEGPYPGFTHQVAAPDANAPGWLPATHSAFAGLPVPAGAKFGYNIRQDPTLSAVWPPSPAYFAQSAVVTIDGVVADETRVIANEYGIWWMMDSYGKAPWSVNFRPYFESSSSSSSSSDAEDLPLRQPKLLLWFNSVAAQTESAFLTSVASPDESIKVQQTTGGVVSLIHNAHYLETALMPFTVLPDENSPVTDDETDTNIYAKRTAYIPYGSNPEAPYGIHDVVDPFGPGALPCIAFYGKGSIALYSLDVARTPLQSRLLLKVRLRVANNSAVASTLDPTTLFSVTIGVQSPTTTGGALPAGTEYTRTLPWSAASSRLPMGGYAYVDIETEARAFDLAAGSMVTLAVRSETDHDKYLLGARLYAVPAQ